MKKSKLIYAYIFDMNLLPGQLNGYIFMRYGWQPTRGAVAESILKGKRTVG
jgi:hypothetical protein